MIAPTIGRIVWFHPGPKAAYPKHEDQPQAAIVAAVLSEPYLNLTVSAPSGDTYPARNVRLIQDGEKPPTDAPYAEWMPYQKGQAAKAEQLERAFHATGPAGNATKGPEAATGKPEPAPAPVVAAPVPQTPPAPALAPQPQPAPQVARETAPAPVATAPAQETPLVPAPQAAPQAAPEAAPGQPA